VIEVERKYLANVRSMCSFLPAAIAEVTRRGFSPENPKSLIQDRIRRRGRGTFRRKKMKKMMMQLEEMMKLEEGTHR
jgi:hypothetical protein